ncbi:hypothetical protein PV04_07425 [Phialophora macrospora]|uniref:Nephrocystin 3-like N-terminal domain-containing protein n=1 Tax=Phialophora macrospora TaxID=1851006 RepID=A0A0D2FAW4_9EURO|nr:hypothetical protein PV04_07425 [Phialophora macrospora]
MKHALKHCENLRSSSHFVLFSFFFHGRGSPIQKTPIGLFRSVLHQILDQVPELLEAFTKIFEEKQEKIGPYGENWEWRESELKHHFRASIVQAAALARIRLGLEIVMEDENRRDIESYVQCELRHYIPDETAVVSLKNVVCNRDSGIFQWFTLIKVSVVEMYLAGTRLTKIDFVPIHN